VLPGATGTEGITDGIGTTFYAGDLLTGDIFRGDARVGSAERFIEAPDGRFAAGMDFDARSGLLFVAGGPTGQGYVYDTRTGEAVAAYQFGAAGSSFINDVTITRTGAWFTDSLQARLYFVPIGPRGQLGAFQTLALSGPAADLSAAFNNNGIAATPDGKTLIVAHSGQGALNTVDPATGQSAAIAGVSVPGVDGILLEAGRLFAVQNASNQISVVNLRPDLASGTVTEVITSDLFEFPTTVARFGGQLAVANAKFDTGFPPTAGQYEVVIVDR
jgi:sugar lactone lactonase YvrE